MKYLAMLECFLQGYYFNTIMQILTVVGYVMDDYCLSITSYID